MAQSGLHAPPEPPQHAGIWIKARARKNWTNLCYCLHHFFLLLSKCVKNTAVHVFSCYLLWLSRHLTLLVITFLLQMIRQFKDPFSRKKCSWLKKAPFWPLYSPKLNADDQAYCPRKLSIIMKRLHMTVWLPFQFHKWVVYVACIFFL